MRRGLIRRIILYALNRKGPLHVYGIIKTIKELSFNTYTPSTGVIYPALKSLLEKGLIKDVDDDGKKIYEITDKGKVAISLDPPVTEFLERMIKTGYPYKEISKVAKLIYDNWDRLSREKREEIKRILEELYTRITEVVMDSEKDN